jgi:hypothetical protein
VADLKAQAHPGLTASEAPVAPAIAVIARVPIPNFAIRDNCAYPEYVAGPAEKFRLFYSSQLKGYAKIYIAARIAHAVYRRAPERPPPRHH